MILKDVWAFLERDVFPLSSNPELFNQYADEVGECDLPGAGRIKRENLLNYVKSFTIQPSILVIGEAPGPHGCRFSGVPFTSEAQLCNGKLPFAGRQSSTYTQPCSEMSANIFWDFMQPCHPSFFVWNCVPFHPHKHGVSLSIRSPLSKEIKKYAPLVLALYSLIMPKRVIAVGKNAERALNIIGVTNERVRHPSHGGKPDFVKGMNKVFWLPSTAES